MSNETFKELDELIFNSGLKLNFVAEELGISRPLVVKLSATLLT